MTRMTMKTWMILLTIFLSNILPGFTWSDEPILYTESGVIIRDGNIQKVWELSDDDMDILMRMAYGEARGQGIEGKALVMLVVLNRWKSGHYGETISAVVKPGQFVKAKTYDAECRVALTWVLYGWDESEGALYFCATGYNGPIHLFKHGGHYFSKREFKEKVYG